MDEKYLESKKELDNLMSDNKIKTIFNDERRKDVIYCVELMHNQLKLLDNDVNVNVNDIDFKKIKDIIWYIRMYILEHPILEYDTNLFKSLSLHIYNWNSNTLWDTGIRVDLETIKLLLDGHYTITMSIEILKFITDKLRKYENFEPPTISLSRHYLQILQGNDKCDSN